MQTLAAEIIQGRRLTRLDDLTPLLQAGLEDLCAGADQIRKALRGAGYEACARPSGSRAWRTSGG